MLFCGLSDKPLFGHVYERILLGAHGGLHNIFYSKFAFSFDSLGTVHIYGFYQPLVAYGEHSSHGKWNASFYKSRNYNS